MTITVSDLKFRQAERMTDEDDGGGMMSAVEILPGGSNGVFDDISDVDRAAGGVSVRKVYAHVASDADDKYLDAGAVIFKPPTDPDVSVLAFSTGDFYDERSTLQDRLESQITRGARMMAYLWGEHVPGQRSVTLWARPDCEIPGIGRRIDLAEFGSDSTEDYNQILWVTRVTVADLTITDVDGTFPIQRMILELAEGLRYAFTGQDPGRYDTGSIPTKVFETRYNAGVVPIFGIKPLTDAAAVSDRSVSVESLYSPLIPTAFVESAIPDATPGGDSVTLVAGAAGTVSRTTSAAVIGPGLGLFVGGPVYPGTLSIVSGGTTITDSGGEMMFAGSAVGVIDYGAGLCTWNASAPNLGAASKTMTYVPAAAPTRVADTASQVVTAENRGFVWIITLAPIPAPKTLRVSYRVNNEWYELADTGGGSLSGADSSYGIGSLEFATGTVIVTTGALPDTDSEIIYSWATPISYTVRGGSAVDAPVARGQTAHAGVAPGTVTVTWSTYTLTDDGAGTLTGTGGTGEINYATGEWWVRPSAVPAIGTEFTIEYDYGDVTVETFAHPAREVDGTLLITLENPPRAGTVEIEWNTLLLTYEPGEWAEASQIYNDPIQTARDDGAGNVPISGGATGTVNYTTGAVNWNPDVTLQIPHATFGTQQIGTVTAGNWVAATFREVFTGWEYIPSGAIYPTDDSGEVTIRYRPSSGGDTSASETVTLEALEFDLTKGYGETITQSSTRFRLGGGLYVNIAGLIYRDPSVETGAGSVAGSLDPSSGRVRLTAWTSGGTNAVTLDSLVTEVGGQPVDMVTFRTPSSPIKPGVFQMRFTDSTGTVYTKTPGSTGILEDGDCTINVDYTRGVVRARFGLWREVADLTEEELAADWYDPSQHVTIAEVEYVWKPLLVRAESIIYNAVATTYLPPNTDLLGLDAARLPPDGQALIYQTGDLALVHHTDTKAVSTLSPSQVIDCERTRLYRVAISDSAGSYLGADQYTVDRAAGTVTMSAALDQTGFTAPWTVHHTIADLLRVTDTDINGTLTFMSQLTHNYPADESYCSGVLFAGTLQARVANVFAQSAWTSVWSDSLIGSAPLASYNDALYPITVNNAGAYKDRILVRFTSSTEFQVIGEGLGVIATGDINTDCSPVNSLTGETYFHLDYRGWGTGWATGNCLRFNLYAAAYPIDLVRAIQPSEPGSGTDCFQLLLIGNIDAS